MFRTRLISGIILVLIALLVITRGGGVLLAVSAILSLIGLFELYRVFSIEKTPLAVIGYIGTLLYYTNLHFHFLKDTMMIVIFLILAFMCCFVFTYPNYHSRTVLAAFFGVFYVSVMLSGIYTTRMLPSGIYLVWLIFICSWGCDTCAYCVGKLFGKHKMTPKLSPKKSVEGAVGGVVGAVLLALIYGFVFQNHMKVSVHYILFMALICGIGSLFSMVGDLAASAIKRNYDIKDYGHLIPGHGGVLDRFDSVIFTAPLIYYLSLYIIR